MHTIDLNFRAFEQERLMPIVGIIYNEDDIIKNDPIYLVLKKDNSGFPNLSFTGTQVILINEETHCALNKNNKDVFVLLWHEFGHWYYQQEQKARGDYYLRRTEAQAKGEIVLEELEADDYAAMHFGKNDLKCALVNMKKMYKKRFPEEKNMLSEFQKRIDRLL